VLTFAIVIPNFNQSHFLPTAFQSLRHQSVPFNLAVMDGGSTDNFEEVAEDFSDIITFLRTAHDEGQAAAIREGKDRIPGDVVAWLNADDYYFPDALDRVASCFERHPEVDVVYGDAIHVSPEGFFLSYFPPIQGFSAKDLMRSCFICQPACFVRRTAYDKVGGIDPALHFTMDWDLWCRLSRSGAKFHYLAELLAAVRVYPATKTLSGDRKRYQEIWRIEKNYGKRLLPFSWLGFYAYDLSCKTQRTLPEEIAFCTLNNLRVLKKNLFKNRGLSNGWKKTIHGFHRWEPIVDRRCTIQLPWYDRRDWKKIRLRLQPVANSYKISINDKSCRHVRAGGDCLLVEVPRLKDAYRRISIENLDQERWKFLGFSCDLS
jgi:glycosyltransferase involved in cell wall biosynthesis